MPRATGANSQAMKYLFLIVGILMLIVLLAILFLFFVYLPSLIGLFNASNPVDDERGN